MRYISSGQKPKGTIPTYEHTRDKSFLSFACPGMVCTCTGLYIPERRAKTIIMVISFDT
jgi:hypothetical protein